MMLGGVREDLKQGGPIEVGLLAVRCIRVS